MTEINKPDFLFEVSWEVCNKVGGIHTVISSKALSMVKELGDNYIVIGPDLWKDENNNPAFLEDTRAYNQWIEHARSKGLKIKMGRWSVPGSPLAILVDFTPLFTGKDEIFTHLWLKYKLDSLNGQWDYIEPALFGYAAGMVIESFCQYHLTFSDKIIAHFHEWMTGCGILYLRENFPQAGTVFTTHATVMARSIAGIGLPLYESLAGAAPDARELNIVAKHSLEKISAGEADCFTTVSDMTARECKRFLDKDPDIVTPNGFDEFIVPDNFLFLEKREIARQKLFQVARFLFDSPVAENTLLVIHSGRYEFRNKGLDVTIDAMEILSHNTPPEVPLILFIFTPAYCTGPRKDIMEQWHNHAERGNAVNRILTHHLQGSQDDPVLQRLLGNHLNNSNPNVRVVFSPVYLNGQDGIYNLDYYDLLAGFDLSIFPSYYEPWGYTPMESLAFRVPSITSNLSGFGVAVQAGKENFETGIGIVTRTDTNSRETSAEIARMVLEFSGKDSAQMHAIRESAQQTSRKFQWKNLLGEYRKAFHMALVKADKRAELFIKGKPAETHFLWAGSKPSKPAVPIWRKIFIQLHLPPGLEPLKKLAGNLWWTWDYEAAGMFRSIDPVLWERSRQNPLVMLNSLSAGALAKLAGNKPFLEKLSSTGSRFDSYMRSAAQAGPSVAYFCMEFGLHADLKLYSGGLGILAGDLLKEASDRNIALTGIGLLYRDGYFVQKISDRGEQMAVTVPQSFSNQPLHPVYTSDGDWLKVSIAFPGRTVFAKIWLVKVGRVQLYLMDTDIPENDPDDRNITLQLYGGDTQTRLQQELFLGIGGVRLLKLLGISPDVFHMNEGHPAFAGIERIRLLMQEDNLTFHSALEVVRASTLFTTHTPVPAGHDEFTEEFIRAYLSHHADYFNMDWEALMHLGQDPCNPVGRKFGMTWLALHFSSWVNSVSKAHLDKTRSLFSCFWKGFMNEELPVGYVTNGVHWASWAAPEWQERFSLAGEAGISGYLIPKLNSIGDADIWNTHLDCKKQLIDRLMQGSGDIGRPGISGNIDPDSLTEQTLIITYARRMVSYKRPLLIFHDPERLENIILRSGINIVFIFAGKAHPKDTDGHALIRHIAAMSARPGLRNSILFIPDYDMQTASLLVKGSDVWLNTPLKHHEASGTSGMKAAMNGVLNLSISDGWWAEADAYSAGWTIDSYTGSAGPGDSGDAMELYRLLEKEVIPAYKDIQNGFPARWVKMIKKGFSDLVPKFTSSRMLEEYVSRYYVPISQRHRMMVGDNYGPAAELAEWKQKMRIAWDKIKVISRKMYDSANKPLPQGSLLTPQIILDLGDLDKEYVGVEMVSIRKRRNEGDSDSIELVSVVELKQVSVDGSMVTFSCDMETTEHGVFEYGFRIFPKHRYLLNKQDMVLLKWI